MKTQVLLPKWDQDLIPGGVEVFCDEQEGHFRIILWWHRLTGVYGATLIGSLRTAEWCDESNSLFILAKALSKLEQLEPWLLVWDLSLLCSIDWTATAELGGYNDLFARRAVCAWCGSPKADLPATQAALLQQCQHFESVIEAIWWLHLMRCPAA